MLISSCTNTDTGQFGCINFWEWDRYIVSYRFSITRLSSRNSKSSELLIKKNCLSSCIGHLCIQSFSYFPLTSHRLLVGVIQNILRVREWWSLYCAFYNILWRNCVYTNVMMTPKSIYFQVFSLSFSRHISLWLKFERKTSENFRWLIAKVKKNKTESYSWKKVNRKIKSFIKTKIFSLSVISVINPAYHQRIVAAYQKGHQLMIFMIPSIQLVLIILLFLIVILSCFRFHSRGKLFLFSTKIMRVVCFFFLCGGNLAQKFRS